MLAPDFNRLAARTNMRAATLAMARRILVDGLSAAAAGREFDRPRVRAQVPFLGSLIRLAVGQRTGAIVCPRRRPARHQVQQPAIQRRGNPAETRRRPAHSQHPEKSAIATPAVPPALAAASAFARRCHLSSSSEIQRASARVSGRGPVFASGIVE